MPTFRLISFFFSNGLFSAVNISFYTKHLFSSGTDILRAQCPDFYYLISNLFCVYPKILLSNCIEFDCNFLFTAVIYFVRKNKPMQNSPCNGLYFNHVISLISFDNHNTNIEYSICVSSELNERRLIE